MARFSCAAASVGPHSLPDWGEPFPVPAPAPFENSIHRSGAVSTGDHKAPSRRLQLMPRRLGQRFQQLLQVVYAHGLDEVRVESGFQCPAAIAVLPITGQRHKYG